MASRRLEDLHPRLKPLAEAFLARCEAAGVGVVIICTYRDGAEQNRLYAQGRTAPGKVVTKAKAGQSAHNFTLDGKPASKAFDICALVDGKLSWDAKAPAWKEAGRIGMELGLNWYGRPGAPFHEMPHFELAHGAA